MRPILTAALLLTLAAPAPAGVISGYDPTPGSASHQTHDRFASGFPDAPVPNSSSAFLASGVDLSGIGWRTADPRLGVTLISPRHLVTAVHPEVNGQILRPGDEVRFFSAGGQLRTYTVGQTARMPTTFTNSMGQPQTLPSDLMLATLTAPIPESDGVRFFPVAGVTAASAVGLPMLAYGQNPAYGTTSPHLGTNRIDAVGLASFNNFQTEATRVMTFDWTPANAGEIYLIGGDSGSPAFLRTTGGDLAVVGVHYGVSNPTTTPNPGDVSVSAFVPGYIAELNQEMAATGYQVTVAPVPEPAGLLALAGTALAAGLVRRRRRPTPGSCRGSA